MIRMDRKLKPNAVLNALTGPIVLHDHRNTSGSATGPGSSSRRSGIRLLTSGPKRSESNQNHLERKDTVNT